MKKQIIIIGSFIALTLAFVEAADAAQSLVATGYTAPIEKMVASNQFPVGADQITGGLVTIDTDHNEISLTVVKNATPCTGKLICPPNLSNTLALKLPIQDVQRDHCGTVAYTATQETTAGRQVIEVRDNSNYSCRNFMMLPKTSVSLMKQTRSGDASATFAAGSLEETH